MKAKKSLVEFTPFIPRELIPHAGGEYVRRHLSALAESYAITIVGPSSSDNIVAAAEVDPKSAKVLLIPPISTPFLSLSRPFRLLYKAFRGASLGFDVEYRIKRNVAIRKALENADMVGFQWTETATLSRYVRKVAPNAKQTLVIHDVLAQRWYRASASSKDPAIKLFYYLRYISARRAEKSAFASVDTVIAFSAKDASMVRVIQPLAHVIVVNPPLIDPGMPVDAPTSLSSGKSVLFTGALNRPENHEAVMWFLREIWPIVTSAVPSANFVIAGAAPRKELLVLSQAYSNVTVTGFVKDLNTFYRDSALFVAPLRAGAGVKFKTITAMLWGLPIVTTEVGAEGIGDHDLFVAVTSNPKDFGDAIVAALKNPESNREIIRSSYQWAHSQYGLDPFRRILESLIKKSS